MDENHPDYAYLAYNSNYGTRYPHNNYWYCGLPILQIQTYLNPENLQCSGARKIKRRLKQCSLIAQNNQLHSLKSLQPMRK